jgi:hypothetical protein
VYYTSFAIFVRKKAKKISKKLDFFEKVGFFYQLDGGEQGKR